MHVGIIGEGETEYNSVPTLVAKLGHVVVGVQQLGGVGAEFPWQKLFRSRIYPYVRGFAVKSEDRRPHKVLIMLDRETREECCGRLVQEAENILLEELAKENLQIPFSVVLANRQFECLLLANSKALDDSPLLRGPVSQLLGDSVDEKNVLAIIKSRLKRGHGWHKARYAKALAQRLDLQDPQILGRSRCLRKFVQELGA
jgi:hypothetical protein